MPSRIGLKASTKREPRVLFFMALPCLIFVFIFHYLPLRGWLYALYNYKPGLDLFTCEFVGLKHFITLFSNQILRGNMIRVIRNTLAMAGLGMLFTPVIIIFAIFLNEMRSSAARRIIQSLATLPHFISWVIMYSLVFYMLSSGGFVNNLTLALGWRDQPVNYLLNTDHVWITQVGYGMWKELGWSAIIYLAAIAGIDQELYEAATIDGAGRFRRMWHITVPGILPTFFVLLIIKIGNILNTGFERYYIFQNAMNKEYIETLDLYVYNQGIGSGYISYATAVGIMKSVVAIVLFSTANSLSKLVRGSSIF